MAEDLISSFISEKGKQELEQAISSLREMLSVIKEVNSNQITVEKKTAGSSSVLELKNNIDSLNKSQSEFARTLQELKKQEDALIQIQAKLNASYYDEAKALAEAKVALQSRNREMMNAAKSAANANNQYERMNAVHKQLVAHAQQLGARFGTESKQFEVAANRANNLGKKLSEIDAMLGNHRRNVGNYASSWNGLNHQVGMVLRELPNLGISLNTFVLSLSNNLPMLFDEIKRVNDQNKILISQGKPTQSALKQMLAAVMTWQTALIVGVTILTKYGDQIFDFVANLIKGNKALTDAEIATKSMITVNQSASQSYADVSINIGLMRNRFMAATATMQDKQDVIKELNRLYGDQIGEIKGINDAEDFFINRSDKFIEAIRIRAQIEGAYDLMKQKTKELLDAQEDGGAKTVTFLQKTAAGLAAFWDHGFSGTMKQAMENTLASYEKQVADAGKRNVNRMSSDVARQNSILESFITDSLKKLQQLNQEGGFNFDGKPKKVRGSSYDPFADDIKASENYINELSKLSQQRLRQEIETSRAIYQDETKSLQERLDAYRIYAFARTALARQEISGELEATQLRLDEIAKLESRANKTYTAAENKLLVQKQELETRKVRLVEQAQAEILKINADGVKDILSIQKSEFSEFKRTLGERTAWLGEAEEKILTKEKERYDRGEISYREYIANVRKIRANYDKSELQFLENIVQEEIDGNKDKVEYVSRLETLLYELKKKLREKNAAEQKTDAQTTKQIEQDVFNYRMRLIENYREAMFELLGIIRDQRSKDIDDIQKQIDDQDKLKQAELDRINATTLSEEEKQKRIIAAESEAEAKRQVLEEKKRRALMQQARVNKAADIANITTSTALAVTRALADSTTTPAAARIPIAAAIGAAGLAQLARAIAAPLPQFATGTESSPEGLAIVGEKGPELKITPKGEVSLTPGRATLDYLEKGTTIIPADRTEQIIRGMGMYGHPISIVIDRKQDNTDLLQAINGQTKKLLGALNKKSQPVIINDRWGWYYNNYVKN